MEFTIKRGSLEIPLTHDEVLQCYIRIRRQYLRDDAIRHIGEYFDNQDDFDSFLEKINIAELIREDAIDEYIRTQDCNIPENDTWHNAVCNVMSAHGYNSI